MEDQPGTLIKRDIRRYCTHGYEDIDGTAQCPNVLINERPGPSNGWTTGPSGRVLCPGHASDALTDHNPLRDWITEDLS